MTKKRVKRGRGIPEYVARMFEFNIYNNMSVDPKKPFGRMAYADNKIRPNLSFVPVYNGGGTAVKKYDPKTDSYAYVTSNAWRPNR